MFHREGTLPCNLRISATYIISSKTTILPCLQNSEDEKPRPTQETPCSPMADECDTIRRCRYLEVRACTVSATPTGVAFMCRSSDTGASTSESSMFSASSQRTVSELDWELGGVGLTARLKSSAMNVKSLNVQEQQ